MFRDIFEICVLTYLKMSEDVCLYFFKRLFRRLRKCFRLAGKLNAYLFRRAGEVVLSLEFDRGDVFLGRVLGGFGTLVELWWNFGGTLVELWWNFLLLIINRL
jgi:hypothetical protein